MKKKKKVGKRTNRLHVWCVCALNRFFKKCISKGVNGESHQREEKFPDGMTARELTGSGLAGSSAGPLASVRWQAHRHRGLRARLGANGHPPALGKQADFCSRFHISCL